MASRSTALRVVLEGDSRGLQQMLAGAEKSAHASFGRIAGYASAAAAGYLSIGAAKDAVTTTEELAHQTLTLHKSFGLSIKSASEWGAVAKARGADGKQLTMGFKSFATQVHNASDAIDGHSQALDKLRAKDQAHLDLASKQGQSYANLVKMRQSMTLAETAAAGNSTKQAKAFEELGISADTLRKHGNDMNFMLHAVSDGLAKMPASTDKAALMAKLFGRTWITIAPLIRDGSKAMNEQLQVADKYGATLSGKTLKQQEALIKSQRELKLATEGLKISFGVAVTPEIVKFDKLMAKVAADINGPGSFDDKMKRLGKDIAPAWKSIRDEFNKELPKIADAVGQEAPKVAGAFVTGFTHANIWGQIAMGGFLLSKFGGWKSAVFAPLGTTMGKTFGEKVVASTAATTAAEGGAARAAGLGLAAKMGLGVAAGIAAWDLSTWLENKLHHTGPNKGGLQDKTSGGQSSLADWIGNALGINVPKHSLTQGIPNALKNLTGGKGGKGGPQGTGHTDFTKGSTAGVGFVGARGKDFSYGSEPQIARDLNALGISLGVRFTGISGHRTPAQSVAAGGTANDPHTRGAAADISGGGIYTIPESVLNKFGLTRPMQTWHGKDERNHIQLLGSGGGGGGTAAPKGGALSISGGGGLSVAKAWKDCLLTWYDPALGGINSSHGQADPHSLTASGEAYNPAAMTCAAPSSYAFGTLLTFKYGGRTVTVKVNDRGGAITGHHFDLSRGAATALGFISQGSAKAKFVVGTGRQGGGTSRSIQKAKTPYEALQNRLGYIGLEQGAGLLTDRQAAQQEAAAIRATLPSLHGSIRLEALGTLRGLPKFPKPKMLSAAQKTWSTVGRSNLLAAAQAKNPSFAAPAGHYTFAQSLNNPWLVAYLNRIDMHVAAGDITQEQGDAMKIAALNKAIPLMSGDNQLAAKGALSQLMPAPVSFYDSVENSVAHIDAQVRAGDLTSDQGRQAKIDLLTDSIPNKALSADEKLGLRGDLADLNSTLDSNTAAQQALADALKQNADAITAQTNFAKSVSATEAASMSKWVTEVISKQMGFGINTRGAMPSYGAARRS